MRCVKTVEHEALGVHSRGMKIRYSSNLHSLRWPGSYCPFVLLWLFVCCCRLNRSIHQVYTLLPLLHLSSSPETIAWSSKPKGPQSSFLLSISLPLLLRSTRLSTSSLAKVLELALLSLLCSAVQGHKSRNLFLRGHVKTTCF